MSRRKFSRSFAVLFHALLPAVAFGGPEFQLSATQIDTKTVQIDVQTDYQGEVTLMASVDLTGQADTDVWIGGSEHLKVMNGRGSALVKAAQVPTYPDGTYTAEILWNPEWHTRDPKSGGAGLNQVIEVRKTIRLRNKDVTAKDAQRAQNGVKWVMMNLNMGAPWDGVKYENLLGKPMEIPITGTWDPNTTQAFYYPAADLTIIRDKATDTVAIWRSGKAAN